MINLKKFREKENLTQQQLADKLEVSRTKINNLETGTRLMDYKTMQKFKEVFNLEDADVEQLSEPTVTYGNDYKTKYFELLEQYKVLSDKLTYCLESKIK